MTIYKLDKLLLCNAFVVDIQFPNCHFWSLSSPIPLVFNSTATCCGKNVFAYKAKRRLKTLYTLLFLYISYYIYNIYILLIHLKRNKTFCICFRTYNSLYFPLVTILFTLPTPNSVTVVVRHQREFLFWLCCQFWVSTFHANLGKTPDLSVAQYPSVVLYIYIFAPLCTQ